jgi:hypothetical protein
MIGYHIKPLNLGAKPLQTFAAQTLTLRYLMSRICTGEAKINIYEQQEEQAENADRQHGSNEAVCVKRLQTCSNEPLWTAESHAKMLPEASYLRVEAQGELGASLMVIAASTTEAHHALTSYVLVAQQDGAGAADAQSQLMLRKTEAHSAFQKEIPFSGSSWGPSERPVLSFHSHQQLYASSVSRSYTHNMHEQQCMRFCDSVHAITTHAFMFACGYVCMCMYVCM